MARPSGAFAKSVVGVEAVRSHVVVASRVQRWRIREAGSDTADGELRPRPVLATRICKDRCACVIRIPSLNTALVVTQYCGRVDVYLRIKNVKAFHMNFGG